MGKKHKKKEVNQSLKPNFIETYWDKIIIILLLLLPLIYFSSFLSADKMIAGSDYLIGGYPLEKWTAEQKEMPLWYPYVFGGIPALGAPVGGSLAPLAQFREIMRPQVVLAFTFIVFFFLAGLGMYLYIKEIGLSKYTAAIGAVIYQFIGNLATTPNAGHAGRAASVAMFPLMLFFIHRALKSKKLLYFILTAFATSFAFYEGHFQITYYGLLFILGYVIYYLIVHRKENSGKDYIKIIGCGLCTVAVICLLMAAVWLPVLGGLGTAARGFERGYEYATSWSMPPLEMIDLIIPTYSGLLDKYWGFGHFKLHLEYFGLLSIIFAIFAIILYWKKPYVKFYTLGIIIVLFVVLGGHTPFFRIFYTIIPGFRLFRAPSLAFFLISFGFVVLGSIGFENIFVKKREQKENARFKKKFYIIGGILLAALVITGLICAAGRDSIIKSMQELLQPRFISELGTRMAEAKLAKISANFSAFTSGIWRTLAFLVIILVMIFLSLKQKVKVWIFAVAAIAITLIDQLPLVAKYLPTAPAPEVYYAADDVVRYIKKDNSVFRVFPFYIGAYPLYYFNYEHAVDIYLLYHDIQSAGGYISNPIQRYQDYIGAGTSVMFNPVNLVRVPKLLDMLNVKYIIIGNLPGDISGYDPQVQRGLNMLKQYLSRFQHVFPGRKYSVYKNNNTLPRAYLVPNCKVLSESEVIGMLQSPGFNPRQAVILEENPEISKPDTTLPLIPASITEYSANTVICSINAPYSGFLVLTDNYHPDWQVFVDSKKETLYQANYTFRAVRIASGKHEVIFEYMSPYFNIGKTITIFAFVLSVGLCVLAIAFKL